MEANDNQILIFENKKKQDRQPDYRGIAKIDGVQMDVALWIKDGKHGKFLSGQIKKAIEKQNEKQNENITNDAQKNEEEVLPF